MRLEVSAFDVNIQFGQCSVDWLKAKRPLNGTKDVAVNDGIPGKGKPCRKELASRPVCLVIHQLCLSTKW